MRTLSKLLIFSHQLKRARIRFPLPPPIHHRNIHASSPSNSQSLEPSSSSQILQPNPNRIPTPEPEPESESDASMNEFLSRFVHSIRPILSQAFPDLNKQTLDSMLLLICQRVVAEIDHSDQEATVDLSEDLWKTINEVSKSVHEAMRRDRMREELKKYLHHDDVKEMCRFAGDVGIRGDMLREFRFKWAREKLEEVEFYRDLERIRENAAKEEEEEEKKVKVESLPERKGKIKYKIYGLDLSDAKWAEVADRVEEAESKFVKDEVRPVVGRSKRIEDKFFTLDWKKVDVMPVLKEWAEALEAKRVDWLALLERIKERNLDLYFKVSVI